MTVSSNITKWLSNITSVTMFTLAFSYFISTTLSETYSETFLSHEAQLFVNCLGSSISLSGWIMSIIISVGDTDCGHQDNADVKKYFKRLKEVEQRVRDSSLMLLFILTGLSFGMDTSNILGVFTLVAIGVGRLFSKYFDVHRMLADDSKFKESTKMENALAMTLFALAFINEVVLHNITWKVYLIAIAVLLELGFLLYKGCSEDNNRTRMMFEETTASLFHFVLIGIALKETSSNAHIMTLAALAVGDSVSRACESSKSRLNNFYHSTSGAANANPLLYSRSASLIFAIASSAIGWVIYEQDKLQGTFATISTVVIVATLLKTLCLLSAILESPVDKTTYNMSVVNYLNNGSTLVMLIGTSMQLASFMSLQDNPVITAIPDLPQFSSTFDGLLFAWIAFVLAISARVIDMVQNGYEQHTDAFATIFYSSLKPNDELGPLTLDETKNPLGSPTLSNAKTSIVLFFLVLTTVFTYLGITTDCPLFTSCNSTSATDSSEHFTYYEQVLSHTVFLLIAVHTIFGFVALSGSPAAAISTRELVRVVVSTAVLVLLATLLTAHSLSMLGLGLAAYIVVDAFGRDFL